MGSERDRRHKRVKVRLHADEEAAIRTLIGEAGDLAGWIRAAVLDALDRQTLEREGRRFRIQRMLELGRRRLPEPDRPTALDPLDP